MSIVKTLKHINPYNRYFLYPMQAAVNEYEQRMERKAANRVAGQNENDNEAKASSDTATTNPAENTINESVNEVNNGTTETSEATETSEKKSDCGHRKHHHKHHHSKHHSDKDIFSFMKKKAKSEHKAEEPETKDEKVVAEEPAKETPVKQAEDKPKKEKKSSSKKFGKKNHHKHSKKPNDEKPVEEESTEEVVCEQPVEEIVCEQPVEEPTSEKQENAEAECPTESIPEQEVKSEEQEKAEAECPVEPAGAEKIASGDTNVINNASTEAAKNNPAFIQEETDGIDFSSLGGTRVGYDMMTDSLPTNRNPYNPLFDTSGTPITEYVPRQPVQNPIQQPVQVPPQQHNFNPVFNMMQGAANPAMAGFTPNPMPGMNTYGNMLQQQEANTDQSYNPAAGFGRHKNDHPPKPKIEKPIKAEPDSVDVDVPDVAEAFVTQKPPKKEMSDLECISDIPKSSPSDELPASIFPNNESFYTRYPDLKVIENIALKHGYQVCFVMTPSQLIRCYVYTIDGNNIPAKGFTIDPGHMYDGRWKIFPVIANVYEGVIPYHMYDRNVVKGNKKVRGPLHEEFIRDLIVGGIQAVTTKPMYSNDEISLNSVIALITINKPHVSNDERKYIRKRLMDLYKSGAFDMYQNIRFKMVDFDKQSKTILLDNIGTPKYYGTKADPNAEQIQIKITQKNFQVLKGENLIPTEEK